MMDGISYMKCLSCGFLSNRGYCHHCDLREPKQGEEKSVKIIYDLLKSYCSFEQIFTGLVDSVNIPVQIINNREDSLSVSDARPNLFRGNNFSFVAYFVQDKILIELAG